MRIGIIVWSLCVTKGGLERLGVQLANDMQRRGHECVVFHQALGQQDPKPIYPLDENIEYINLKLHDTESVNIARALVAGSNIEVMCAMFSWRDLLWMPALMNGTGIPLIISEHSNPHFIESERWNRYERIACMAGADAIHLLNHDFIQSLPSFLHDRVTVISNPAPKPQSDTLSRESLGRRQILAVGRLQDQVKQYSLLITAFALLAPKFKEWDLCICGDGEEHKLYEELASKLGLAERVKLPGRVDDLDEYFRQSHIFCMPSRFEGFGLAAVEAQGYSLPVVGFAGCSGINQIVIDGKNGLLAPEMSVPSLTVCLRMLMKNDKLRIDMGAQGRVDLERYDSDKIFGQWEQLFIRAAACKERTKLNYGAFSQEDRAKIALEEILSRPHPLMRLGFV